MEAAITAAGATGISHVTLAAVAVVGIAAVVMGIGIIVRVIGR